MKADYITYADVAQFYRGANERYDGVASSIPKQNEAYVKVASCLHKVMKMNEDLQMDFLKFARKMGIEEYNPEEHRKEEIDNSENAIVEIDGHNYWVFKKSNRNKKKKAEDDWIFAWLINQRVKGKTLRELESLNVFTEEQACALVKSGCEPLISSTDEEIWFPSQKWHLYVSYMAYQELNGKYGFSNAKKISHNKPLKDEPFRFTNNFTEDFKSWCVKAAGIKTFDCIKSQIANSSKK